MKTLIAGPWVGEFGWELFAWQGYVRALSRKFDKTMIISRLNSKALYDDFADEFVSYEPVGGLADSYFMHGVDIKKCFMEVISKNKIAVNKDTTLLLPRRIGFPPHTHYEQLMIFGEHMVKPEYVQYGNPAEQKYDFVFHIRDRDLRKEDNWAMDNWNLLKEKLNSDKIACIGTKSESGYIRETKDLRDAPLKEVFNALAAAECCFGPSSGPMHMASLCGCPHVVWSIDSNKIRYEENWNPLNTEVLFDSEHEWHPASDYVYNKFINWIEEKK